MPNEQSKAAKRRLLDSRFADRWFVGDGIDIGCGTDPLSFDLWPNITSVLAYDRIYTPSCNAQTLEGIDSGSLDFVHSSHCLEHMVDPAAALEAWLDVLKPGGFLVCTIPDWVMYEGCVWPSRYNNDHKCAFTLDLEQARLADRRGVPIKRLVDFIVGLANSELEHVTLLTQHYNPALRGVDQTQGPAECAIEFVLRKALHETD